MYIVEYRSPDRPYEACERKFFSEVAAEVFADVMAAASGLPTRTTHSAQDRDQTALPQ
jgi:hypothetical protein